MRKLVLIFAILLTGCLNKSNIEESSSKQREDSLKQMKASVFKNRNKQQKFLFLNYWIGMTPHEYQIITDSLIFYGEIKKVSDTIIFTITSRSQFDPFNKGLITETDFQILPTFKDGSLRSVSLILRKQELPLFEENIIDLYNEKYGTSKIEKTEPIKYYRKSTMYSFGHNVDESEDIYNRYWEYTWIKDDYVISCIKYYWLDVGEDEFNYYITRRNSLLGKVEIRYTTNQNYRGYIKELKKAEHKAEMERKERVKKELKLSKSKI